MTLTHNIYLNLRSTSTRIWDYQTQSFTPIENGAHPIPHHALPEELSKAQAVADNTAPACKLKIETILYLPVPDMDSNLAALLDNSTATICTCPA